MYGMPFQLKNRCVIKFKQCFNWPFLVFPEADKRNHQKKLTVNKNGPFVALPGAMAARNLDPS